MGYIINCKFKNSENIGCCLKFERIYALELFIHLEPIHIPNTCTHDSYRIHRIYRIQYL